MLLMVMSVARVGARGAVADAGDSIAVPAVAPATAEAPSPTSDFKVDSLPLFNRLPPKVKNYLNGFMAGSVDRTREKRVDLSFGISPSYTREASFGIGALCTGLYRVVHRQCRHSVRSVCVPECFAQRLLRVHFQGQQYFPRQPSATRL